MERYLWNNQQQQWIKLEFNIFSLNIFNNLKFHEIATPQKQLQFVDDDGNNRISDLLVIVEWSEDWDNQTSEWEVDFHLGDGGVFNGLLYIWKKTRWMLQLSDETDDGWQALAILYRNIITKKSTELQLQLYW